MLLHVRHRGFWVGMGEGRGSQCLKREIQKMSFKRERVCVYKYSMHPHIDTQIFPELARLGYWITKQGRR